MIDYIDSEEMLAALRTTLEGGGTASFTVKGRSMLPLLVSEVDTVTLKKPCFPLARNDITLHIRRDGTPVLHRVAALQGDSYIIRGDNCYYDEQVNDKDIIAVVTSLTHKGKPCDMNGFAYRAYCSLYCCQFAYFLRKYVYRRLRTAAGKVKRFVIKK